MWPFTDLLVVLTKSRLEPFGQLGRATQNLPAIDADDFMITGQVVPGF